MSGVGVHERVGGGVVALAGIAEGTGQGREAEEQLQWLLLGQLIEVDQTGDLGSEDPVELLGALADHEVVLDDPGGVQHAGQRAVVRGHPGQQGAERVPVGHVDGLVPDGQARAAQGVQRGAPLVGQRGAPGEDHRGVRDRGGDVPRDVQAESAHAAGDQVDAVLPPGRGGGPGAGDLGEAADLAAAVVVVAYLGLRGGGGLGREAGRDGGGRGAVQGLQVLGVQLGVLQVDGAQQRAQARETGRQVAVADGGHLEQGGPAHAPLQQPPGQREHLPHGVGVLQVQRAVGEVEDGALGPGGQGGPQGVAVSVGGEAEDHDVPFREVARGSGRDLLLGPLGSQEHHVGAVGGRGAGGWRGPVWCAVGVEVVPAAFAGEGVTGQADPAYGGVGRPGVLPAHLGAVGPPGEEVLVRTLPCPGVQGGVCCRGVGGTVRADGPPVPGAGRGGVGGLAGLGEAAGGEGEALLESHASGLQGPGDRGQVGVGRLAEPGVQTAGLFNELGLALRGEHQQRGAAVGQGFGRAGRRLVLGDDDVGVGAAAAETGHPGGARQRAPLQHGAPPRLQGPLDAQRGALEVDVRVEGRGVQARHEFAVAHLEQHLGEGGDTGGGLQVPDVGLHGADREPLGRAAREAEGLLQTADFDRVTQGGTGAVGLQIAQGARVDAGRGERLGDDLALGDRGGHRVPGSASAVVDRGAFDHRVDLVAVRDGALQRFEEDGADALAGHVAVAALAETPATAVAGEELALPEHEVLVGVRGEVDAARQRGVALTAADGLAGQVEGGQGGGAHGVHGHARAVEVVEVRHPVGDRGRAAPQGVGSAALLRLGAQELVLLVHHTDEHADLRAAREPVGCVSGVLQGVVGALQEQPLLRVQVVGLKQRYVEEQRIEPVDVVQESAPAAGAGLGVPAVVPAAGGNLAHAVATRTQVLPELLEGVRLGVAAAQADDRDVAGAHGFRFGRRLDGGQRAAGQTGQLRAHAALFVHDGDIQPGRGPVGAAAGLMADPRVRTGGRGGEGLGAGEGERQGERRRAAVAQATGRWCSEGLRRGCSGAAGRRAAVRPPPAGAARPGPGVGPPRPCRCAARSGAAARGRTPGPGCRRGRRRAHRCTSTRCMRPAARRGAGCAGWRPRRGSPGPGRTGW